MSKHKLTPEEREKLRLQREEEKRIKEEFEPEAPDSPDAEEQFKLDQSEKAVKALTDRKSKSSRFSFVFFLLTIVILVVIAVTEFVGEEEHPLSTVMQIWSQNWQFVVIALLVVLIMLFVDCFKQTMLLRGSTGKWKFKLTMKSTMLGKYFDNITPSAFGGQPYQIYYLHKNKVPAGVATSLPLVGFFMQQMAFLVIIIASFIFRGDIIPSLWLRICIIIGSVFMIFIPVTVMIFAFIPKTTKRIAGAIVRFLHKIKIVKHPDAALTKVHSYLDDYSKSLKLIGKHKKTLLCGFVLSLTSQLLYYSVTYFLIRACGVTEDYWTIVACMAYTSAAGALIPTPGSSGVAEGLFYIIFDVLPVGLRFWTMLMWRLMTYYLPTLIGLGVYINNTVKDKKYRERGLIRTSFADDDDELAAKPRKQSEDEPTDGGNDENGI